MARRCALRSRHGHRRTWKPTALLAEVGAEDLATVADPDGRLAVSWGAHGVPETFLLDRDGVIRAFRPGAITEGWIREHVDPVVRAP